VFGPRIRVAALVIMATVLPSAIDYSEAARSHPARSMNRHHSVAARPRVQPPGRFVYYRNCSAARAAGAAPVRRSDPGYAPHLDRDNDGVGCE
jgi:hypothetical protein